MEKEKEKRKITTKIQYLLADYLSLFFHPNKTLLVIRIKISSFSFYWSLSRVGDRSQQSKATLDVSNITYP